ncbi:MAG: zinc-ribbon domain-containing protein [Candidatus Thorarchaeota archaeon]
MNHMMNWGPNGWYLLVFGGLLFFLFIVILLYILSRGIYHHKNLANNMDHETYENNEFHKMQTQEIYSAISGQKNMKISTDFVNFCPTCGEKLDSRTVKFCPFCGTKIELN